jgi:uncharacterized repeat protein (TIGR01451 family)
VAISVLALTCALVATTTAVPAPGDTANLRVTKSDSPDPVTVGALLTYTIEVTNLGPEGATNVTVTDRLPAQVDFVSANATSGTCERNGRNVTCDIGAIPSGTAGNVTPARVTIRVRPTRAGNINNVASVDSAENDPVAANNAAAEATRVVQPSAPQPAACRGVTATRKGTAGDDVLTGTGGPDVIAAFGGDDVVRSGTGRDLICAGRGIDFVSGGTAADRVFGGPDRDRLLGRGGPDRLRGGPGPDRLRGGFGSDRLRGGAGFDRCRGGPGADSRRSCEA